jgi:Serpin (serine protease inhibitor)
VCGFGALGLRFEYFQLGMERMFTDAAEFDDMLEGHEPLKVSEVVHKAFIEVNEEGAEAAAATGNFLSTLYTLVLHVSCSACRPWSVYRLFRMPVLVSHTWNQCAILFFFSPFKLSLRVTNEVLHSLNISNAIIHFCIFCTIVLTTAFCSKAKL